jgi:hypothetical protein
MNSGLRFSEPHQKKYYNIIYAPHLDSMRRRQSRYESEFCIAKS